METTGDRLIKLQDVMAITAMSRASVFRRIRDASFPKGVQVGPRAVRWRESEVQRWIAERKSQD